MTPVRNSLEASLMFFVVVVAAQAQDLGVAGHWATTWSDKEAVYTAALTLKTSGDQITGAFTDRNGIEWQIQNGKLEGNLLTLDASSTANGGATSLQLVGNFVNDVITLRPGPSGSPDPEPMVFHRTDKAPQAEPPAGVPGPLLQPIIPRSLTVRSLIVRSAPWFIPLSWLGSVSVPASPSCNMHLHSGSWAPKDMGNDSEPSTG